jgi:hypothetical protein
MHHALHLQHMKDELIFKVSANALGNDAEDLSDSMETNQDPVAELKHVLYAILSCTCVSTKTATTQSIIDHTKLRILKSASYLRLMALWTIIPFQHT